MALSANGSENLNSDGSERLETEDEFLVEPDLENKSEEGIISDDEQNR